MKKRNHVKPGDWQVRHHNEQRNMAIRTVNEIKTMLRNVPLEARIQFAQLQSEKAKKLMQERMLKFVCGIGGEVEHFIVVLDALLEKKLQPVTISETIGIPSAIRLIDRKTEQPIRAINFTEFNRMIRDGRFVIEEKTMLEVPFNLLIGSSIIWMNNFGDRMADFVMNEMTYQCGPDLSMLAVEIAKMYAFNSEK